MAYNILRQGDIQQARDMFENSIRGAQKADLLILMVYAVEGLASMHVSQLQLERAVQLFAWADAMREEQGDQRPLIEQDSVDKDLAVIHAKLGEAEFAEFSAEGTTMTVEQAIALALEEM